MTLGAGYFRERYAASADPWGLADRWYEARKYALSLALLPREHYSTAFEPGCSIGVLTARLAVRCDRLLACDAVAEAVQGFWTSARIRPSCWSSRCVLGRRHCPRTRSNSPPCLAKR